MRAIRFKIQAKVVTRTIFSREAQPSATHNTRHYVHESVSRNSSWVFSIPEYATRWELPVQRAALFPRRGVACCPNITVKGPGKQLLH